MKAEVPPAALSCREDREEGARTETEPDLYRVSQVKDTQLLSWLQRQESVSPPYREACVCPRILCVCVANVQGPEDIEDALRSSLMPLCPGISEHIHSEQLFSWVPQMRIVSV